MTTGVMITRWLVIRRSPRAVEVEVRAGRWGCLSVCSWFRWEERRRIISVLLIWRERVMLLRSWPRRPRAGACR